MQLAQLDLDQINNELRDKEPTAILRWALSLNVPTILTTSFGYNSAVSLHMLAETDASVPVVWVDSGYNAKDAYVVAEKLMTDLNLNMHIYNPLQSAERRAAVLGVPGSDEPEFATFTEQVKLEPFKRALDELKPQVWISGIRKEETEHRQNLDIVSIDNQGILKVAPIFYWSEDQVEAYMAEHNLPNCKHYFDPTKVAEHAECGLHTLPS